MPQDARFRLGLIGAGLITQQAHLPAALASDAVDVAAIVDPAPGRAAALARDYGIRPITATTLDEALPHIDGAIIATPNDSHGSLGLKCIEAGVAALIEKPLCSTLADAQALVAAAERTGIALAVGYSTRFRDNTMFLKELLDAGEFGKVRRFVHQFGTSGGWAALSAYNLQRKTSGGGVLIVTGTHFVDRMMYFWGYPDEFHLEDDGINGPEANATATFSFHSNGRAIEGAARYSKTGSLPAGLVIETERGLVKLRDSDDAQITFHPLDRQAVAMTYQRRGEPRFDPRVSVFQHQIEEFVDAARMRRQPMVDGRQGLASMRLLEALYNSRHTVLQRWYTEALNG